MNSVTVGIHVHADPALLVGTLEALAPALPPGAGVVLLPDGPDAETAEALARMPRLRGLRRWGTDAPGGPPACFNRLAAHAGTEVVILLESGARPARDALSRLVAALAGPSRVGLAGPSTNRSWNEQQILPRATGTAMGLAVAAHEAYRRFGDAVRPPAPPHSLADFCLAVRADVLETVGPADEGFGLGPCWELEYSARAARAGFTGGWVGAAFVHRAPFSRRRQLAETRLSEVNRWRCQDRLAGRVPIRGGTPAAPPPRRDPARARGRTVSCVMPTADRPEFVAQALRYLLRQDHEAWEIVIVDDGVLDTRAAVDQHRGDPRIRWVRMPSSASIGHKRNVGCERARGDFIAHWDDDDWYGAGRLRAQLAPLVAGNAEISALRDTVWFDVAAWRFRQPVPSVHRRLFGAGVHCGTLLYRRSVWEQGHRFEDVSLGEDALFLRTAVRRGNRLAGVPGAGVFLYVRHAGNTWRPPGQFTDGWRDLGEPRELGGDREFYAALPGASPPGFRAVPDAGALSRI